VAGISVRRANTGFGAAGALGGERDEKEIGNAAGYPRITPICADSTFSFISSELSPNLRQSA
jgi:hypothetical protein